MSGTFSRIAAAAVTRRGAVVAATAFIALLGFVAALSLDTDASTDTLVNSGSEAHEATERFRENFGDDAIAVLVTTDDEHDLRDLMLTDNLAVLLRLEGCLAGNAPSEEELTAQARAAQAQAGRDGGGEAAPEAIELAPACEQLARSDAVRVVYGPATFLNQAVAQTERFLAEQSEETIEEARAAAAAAFQRVRAQGLSQEEARQAALLAGQEVIGEFQQQLLQMAISSGLTGIPRLNDPQFVSQVVFDERLGGGRPKARFAYLFPSSDAALISVRLEPGLDSAERAETIEQIRSAVSDDAFELSGGDYVVSGVPVVVEELAGEFRGELIVLLIGALAVMAIALTVVFGPPLRLLPLGLAVAATAVTFGVLALTGGSLTMASIAVLPVLIGLSVDYAIQFQARYREASAGNVPALRAARSAAARGGPVIATAALATAAGLLVLLLSPIPMVRGFGLLLVVGIAFALVASLTTGFAMLTAAARRRNAKPLRAAEALSATDEPPAATDESAPTGNESPAARDEAEPEAAPAKRSRLPRPNLKGVRPSLGLSRLTRVWRSLAERFVTFRRGAGGWFASVWSDGGRRLVALRARWGARLTAASKRVLALAITAPGRILAIALVFAVAGWIASTRTEVVSDLRELVPAGVLEAAGVDELQEETGVSGEMNVLVTAPDLTDPEVVSWMGELKERILARGGFGGRFASCEAAQICPQIALPDLFTESGGNLTRRRVRTVLDAVPPYFSQAVITRDPETGKIGNTANIAFGIRLMPLDQQKTLIDAIRAEIDPPGTDDDAPEGVEAELAGLPVLAADANAELSRSQYLLAVLALVAVGLVLLAVYRSPRRALIPLIPIVLATGWAALALWAMQVPLNPMSATLGALVIAIATEFSVLLSARFREEREAGQSVGEALRRTYARTGTAVLASGVTTVAGFAVLILSEIRMLRDFGIVTVVDLVVALVGVMVVLPAVLVLAESRARGMERADPGGPTTKRLRRLVPARRGARGA